MQRGKPPDNKNIILELRNLYIGDKLSSLAQCEAVVGSQLIH